MKTVLIKNIMNAEDRLASFVFNTQSSVGAYFLRRFAQHVLVYIEVVSRLGQRVGCNEDHFKKITYE